MGKENRKEKEKVVVRPNKSIHIVWLVVLTIWTAFLTLGQMKVSTDLTNSVIKVKKFETEHALKNIQSVVIDVRYLQSRWNFIRSYFNWKTDGEFDKVLKKQMFAIDERDEDDKPE